MPAARLQLRCNSSIAAMFEILQFRRSDRTADEARQPLFASTRPPLPGLVGSISGSADISRDLNDRASATSLFQKAYYLAFDDPHRTNRLKQAK